MTVGEGRSYDGITVVIPVLNAARYLPDCLASVRAQRLAPGLGLEVLAVDGGSTDATCQIAADFGAKVLSNPDVLAEAGVERGFRGASYRIRLVLAADNQLPHPDWIARLLGVFEATGARCVYTHVVPRPDRRSISRYWSLSQTDPFSRFVYGRASDPRRFHSIYRPIAVTSEYAMYDLSTRRPLLALAQGTAVDGTVPRTRDLAVFDDVLPMWDMIDSGDRFVYYKTGGVVHDTVGSLHEFRDKYRRRASSAADPRGFGFMSRWSRMDFADQVRALCWPLSVVTLVRPVSESIAGWRRDRDAAWLWHPVVSLLLLAFATSALVSVVAGQLRRSLLQSLGG